MGAACGCSKITSRMFQILSEVSQVTHNGDTVTVDKQWPGADEHDTVRHIQPVSHQRHRFEYHAIMFRSSAVCMQF